jgi:hypothetical protein
VVLSHKYNTVNQQKKCSKPGQLCDQTQLSDHEVVDLRIDYTDYVSYANLFGSADQTHLHGKATV